MTTPYTVFTHVLDDDNAVRGQVDSPLARGDAPTTSSFEREVITDRYEIALEPEARKGEYAVEIGKYDPESMGRLPVYDAQGAPQGDRTLLKGANVARYTRVLGCDGRRCSCP